MVKVTVEKGNDKLRVTCSVMQGALLMRAKTFGEYSIRMERFVERFFFRSG